MKSGKSSDETIETGYAIQCAKTERLGLCNKLKELKKLQAGGVLEEELIEGRVL